MKIKRGKFDTILNGLCLIILVSTILFLAAFWAKLPNKVPMHYDFAGNIDKWGSKFTIITLPTIAWIIYIFFIIIERYPQIWNTGVKVTDENKERVYSTLLHLLNTVKFICVCTFTYVTIHISSAFKLSVWFLPIFLFVMFGSLLYWIYKLFKVM